MTGALVVCGVIFVVFSWLTVWSWRDRRRLARMTPEQAEAVRQARRERAVEARRRLEEQRAQRRAGRVGYAAPVRQVTADGQPAGLACPKCGGTQFAARRKTSTKVMFGVASLAARPHHAECVACGYMFRRPNQ